VDLVRYAEELNLDARRFAKELASGTHEPRVHRDFASGVRSGVNGTPTFFINGIRHNGSYDLDTLLSALRAGRL
jgi:protein-disulfide isomerase